MGVIAAMSGRLDPMWAMLAMALSVSAVLLRSLTMRA
jgi:cation transport ATPase